MSGSLNKVQLIGHLGKDPEIRSFQNGGKAAMAREGSIWQGGVLRDKLEGLRARAVRLTNLKDFYKWSVSAGLVGVVAGVGTIAFSATLNLSLGWFTWLRGALP